MAGARAGVCVQGICSYGDSDQNAFSGWCRTGQREHADNHPDPNDYSDADRDANAIADSYADTDRPGAWYRPGRTQHADANSNAEWSVLFDSSRRRLRPGSVPSLHLHRPE